ncbi:ATP-binding cassette domain-containing protein [Pseudooceanicola sp. CBS1P-1]|uniref:ATP-binding cassette domain-containing protein n=1 Tax=Pseudooceanicola albus TaxID=2692189 RepID=A0A6L7G2M5_9RHOB|nr:MULTISPECIES: ATP-binding cassette domain-containing protein [Pseudooceanicola]MBT9383832.1 ATP-binding cassette domain-containing protein [Pseudooceanicola endophyticus]MXN17686.1 ATP-binding cassette domain-containing protein [Pseudooceanicola albus]
MSEKPDRAAARAAEARLIAPVSPQLQRAGALSVLAGLLWPVQAGGLAWAVSGWASGTEVMQRSLWAAAIFLVCVLLRALLEHRAGALLFRAADRVIGGERARILGREALSREARGSAAVAALCVQKLPMLQPWITRYRVAALKVLLLPLALLLLSGWVSWVVALILLVSGPLIPLFMALVGMAAEEASRRQLGEIASMNDMLMDRLSALQDIRLLGATERAAADFEQRAEGLRARTMAVLRIAFLSSTVLELFAAIGVAMVAVYVGFSLLGVLTFGTWGQPMTLSGGLFVLLLAPEFFQPLRDLAAAWHDRASGLAVAQELAEAETAERLSVLGEGTPATPLAGPLAVEIRSAVAALPGRLLALPDLTLKAGEAVALSGPSGAGKSTCLMALAGLVPLAEGEIRVCGRLLDGETADAWRARMAFLPQRPHFGDMTLEAYLGGPDADLETALDLAQAGRIVARLPEGLATRLGERGGGVSGGEARRLMIARAVASERELILADEPTADLDAETGARVIRALLDLRGAGRTLVVATHDPALIAALDRAVEVSA